MALGFSRGDERERLGQSSSESGLVPGGARFLGGGGPVGVRLGRWDVVCAAPDGEVADDLVLDVGWQCPLLRRTLSGTSATCLIGDPILQLDDTLCELIEVVAGLGVVSQHGWDGGQPSQRRLPVRRGGGSGHSPGEGRGRVLGRGQGLPTLVPGRLVQHSLRCFPVDPAQRKLAAQERVGSLSSRVR